VEFDDTMKTICTFQVYGKTLESVRHRRRIVLCTSEEELTKNTRKPTFNRAIRFSDALVAVELFKERVVLDKPSYLGAVILDESKVSVCVCVCVQHF
jgi:hypothetical protein